ncbi:MAG TPA: septal ring lytic transglycosylase RlpA family protein [Acidimicrobiales bacterium]
MIAGSAAGAEDDRRPLTLEEARLELRRSLAQRSSVLVALARATDDSDAALSEVQAAEAEAAAAARRERRARAVVSDLAVAAYVRSSTVTSPSARTYLRATGGDLTARLAELERLTRRHSEQTGALSTRRAEAIEAHQRMRTARRELAAVTAQVGELDVAVQAGERARARALASMADTQVRSPAERRRVQRATEELVSMLERLPLGPAATLPAGWTPTGQRIEGLASWYGPGFHGRATASGAIYDQELPTVAHRTLPLGTFLWISREAVEGGVLVVVNDRGPYIDGRVLDLSHGVASWLGISGLGHVRATIVQQ